jgi:hypothetical protein
VFRLIVLLNTLGNLVEKMISNRFQHNMIKYDIMDPNQMGGVRQRSMEDAGLFLTHLVRSGWQRAQANATMMDIIPIKDDEEHIKKSFKVLISNFILCYAPGSKSWPTQSKMLDPNLAKMPEDRPLEPQKTDMRPLGVFDVNEGSKKGIVNLLHEIPKRIQQDVKVWSSRTQILLGDWLSA